MERYRLGIVRPADCWRHGYSLRAWPGGEPALLRWRRRARTPERRCVLKKLLAAFLAVSAAMMAAPVAGQVLEKAAPEDVQFTLERVHRVAMTHARRVENAEPAEK